MLRKIVFVLVAALALPLLAATAAGADVQYPPTGEGSTVPSGGDRSAAPSGGAAGTSQAPLARTGTDVALLGGVAVVLLGGGAIVVLASRRRTASL